MYWYGAVSGTAVQSQTSQRPGSNVWVTSAATECPLRMRSCATETCSVPAQVLMLAATLASVPLNFAPCYSSPGPMSLFLSIPNSWGVRFWLF